MERGELPEPLEPTAPVTGWAVFRAAHPIRDLHRLGARMGGRYLDAIDEASRADALGLIEEAAEREPVPAALGALHVLRQLRRPEAIPLVRRIVASWPMDHQLRYTLSNTLFLVDAERSGLEALQHRIIGRSMELHVSKKRDNYGFTQHGASIVGKHLADVARIRAFLEGTATYPSVYLAELAEQVRGHEGKSLDEPALRRLTGIADRAQLAHPAAKPAGARLVVLDTNAIADEHVYQWLASEKFRFIAPPGVLLEFARWDAIQHVPWQFDSVEIRRVRGRILPEIDAMFSKRKRQAPSETDKHVAMLALEQRAAIIVSDDRDLWDSGMTHAVEKNTGVRIQVLGARAFDSWAKRQ